MTEMEARILSFPKRGAAFSPNKTESKGKVEVHFRQISAELRTHSEVAYHYLQRKFGIMGLLVIRTSPLHHKLC